MNDESMSNLREAVAALLRTAESAYMEEAGGEAVCKLHKDGRVSGGLKYEEGRVVALRDLQRALRMLEDDAAADQIQALLAAELVRWQADLDHQLAQNRPLPWVAYAQGGVDALQALDT
jgi:hypothetical protein